jgi:PAS domain S-box-containing protein
MRVNRGKLPFSYLLMVVLFAIIITVVLAGIWTNYETSRSNLQENADRLRTIAEEHIDSHFRIIHVGLKAYDSMYDAEMEDAFDTVMTEYTLSGGDPSRMDLPGLKDRIGGLDILVINDTYAVEFGTKAPDPWRQLAAVSPEFIGYLRGIRNISGFYPDRVVQNPNTGKLTKSGYMSTPDHRYIIEIERTGDPVSEGWMELQYSDVVEEVQAFNPYLESALLFRTSKHAINDDAYIPTPEESAVLDDLLGNRTTRVVTDPVSKRTAVWEVIDMRDPDYIADMSIFAKLTFNDALLADEENRLASLHALAALFVLLTGGLLAVTVTRRISRPIEQLAQDVDAVAAGDLDHPIRPVAWYEFSELAEKTGVMVERLRGEIRQREASEQRYTDLVQLLPLGVFETDLSGGVTFANAAALEILGLGPDALRSGLNIFSLMVPEDTARAKDAFAGVLHGRRSAGSEYTGLRPDGSTLPLLAYTAARLEDGAVAGVRGSIVDISRLKEIEAEMRALNEELEERVVRRTQELEAFTYSVSHDLRAPLRAIDGYSAILSESAGKQLGERDRRYLEEVRQTVRQMNALIDGLLALSRLDRQELVRERVDPAPLVAEVVSVELEQDPGREVEVTVGDLPPCCADRAMLRQVFANLVGNAFKFTRYRDGARVEICATTGDGETVYYVRDNGVGFDAADATRLFAPFQRLHRADRYEGSGIGLATADRIVRRHGGRIWAEAAPDEGATFFFVLPGA